MKLKNILLTIVAIAVSVVSTVAQSFSYQAVVRNPDGSIIANQNVGTRVSLVDAEKNVCYSETHALTTNSYGALAIQVGAGKVETGSFAAVPWSTMNVSLKLEIKTTGEYAEVGVFPIAPVPYAMYSASAPREIVATTDDELLFVVKNKAGEPVFEVYPNNVIMYIDETEEGKAVKSGFAITKRTTGAKAETADYLTITDEGVKIYVDEAEEGKAVKSGFAITKRTTGTKASEDNYFEIDGNGTRIYVESDESKAVKSGFAITKRTPPTKEEVNANLFTVEADNGVEVVIDDADDSKAVKSGFAIASKKKPANKAAENYDYFTVTGDSTRIYVNNDFVLTDKNTKQSVMSMSTSGVDVATNLYVQGAVASEGAVEKVAPRGWYTVQGVSFDGYAGLSPDSYAFSYRCADYGRLETFTISKVSSAAAWEDVPAVSAAITYVINRHSGFMYKYNGAISALPQQISSSQKLPIPTELSGKPLFYFNGEVPADCSEFPNGFTMEYNGKELVVYSAGKSSDDSFSYCENVFFSENCSSIPNLEIFVVALNELVGEDFSQTEVPFYTSNENFYPEGFVDVPEGANKEWYLYQELGK